MVTDFFQRIKNIFTHRVAPRDVALVLSGGGARGYAHIGAIEELERRGYHITSVAGTSIGALVGGLYAAGKLQELKSIVLGINRKEMLHIMDISPGFNHLMSGNKLMDILNELVGDTRIEDLPKNFCCVASDLSDGSEKVFYEGMLSQAIRASISIPCFFKPVIEGHHVYVDGSIHNTLPLNRVQRHPHDILVAVNVSAPDDTPWTSTDNYFKMAVRVSQVAVITNTQMAMKITPPDICVDVPLTKFGMMEFNNAEEIIDYGREEMARQLDAFEERKMNRIAIL